MAGESDNLSLDQLTETQSSKYLTTNNKGGQIDAALTEIKSIAISTTSPVVISSNDSTRAVRFTLDDDATPPVGDFTVQFPATKRGFINVQNNTTFVATIEVSGQSSPPTLAAGQSRIYMLTSSAVLAVGVGAGSGGSSQEVTWHGARRHFSTHTPAGTGAFEVVGLDAAAVDTDSFEDASNGFTIPAGVTRVLIRAMVRQDSGTTPSNKWAIHKNGALLTPANGGFVGKIDADGYADGGESFMSGLLDVEEDDTFQLVMDASSATPEWSGWFEVEAVEGSVLGTYTIINTTTLKPFYEKTHSDSVALDTYTHFSVPTGLTEAEMTIRVPGTSGGLVMGLRINEDSDANYNSRRLYSWSTSTEDSAVSNGADHIKVSRAAFDVDGVDQFITVRISQPVANGPVYVEGRVNCPYGAAGPGALVVFSGYWDNPSAEALSKIGYAAEEASDMPANTYVKAYDGLAVGETVSTSVTGSVLVDNIDGEESDTEAGMKGNVVTALGDWKVHALTAFIHPSASGEVYKAVIYQMVGSSNEIDSKVAETDSFTSTGSDVVKPIFTFSSPVDLTSGTSYGMVIVRIDGDTCRIRYQSVEALNWAGFSFQNDIEHVSESPADGTTLDSVGAGHFSLGLFIHTGDLTSTFIGLDDTPSSFSGESGKFVRVNSGGNAVGFHTLVAADVTDSTTAGRSMLKAADAAAQTALLNAFTSAAKGLAPASGGGTTKFLRADGTWADPGGSSGSSYSEVVSESSAFTLALSHAGQWVRVDNASAINVTVPPQTDIAWADDTEIHIEQKGAGQVTIVAGTGVTINTPETLKLSKQWAVATLKRVAENEWTLAGYLEAA